MTNPYSQMEKLIEFTKKPSGIIAEVHHPELNAESATAFSNGKYFWRSKPVQVPKGRVYVLSGVEWTVTVGCDATVNVYADDGDGTRSVWPRVCYYSAESILTSSNEHGAGLVLFNGWDLSGVNFDQLICEGKKV